MTKPLGYFGGDYTNPAINGFATQFEQQNGDCSLSDPDRAALVAVLAVHAWGLQSGLEHDFYTNVDHAIGDGVGTSAEDDEDGTSPMNIALTHLSTLTDPVQGYCLIAWLTQ